MGRCFGSQPRAKVSMMIMRPPQQGHGRGSMRGWSASGCGLGYLGLLWAGGTASKLAGARDVGGAVAIGEQPVVADAMEALRQDVHQEAADELVRGERHRLVAGGAVGAIILVSEGDAVVVAGDQSAVGDGDAVGVARQISEHRLGSAERRLEVDVPLDLARRRQIGGEGFGSASRACLPKN